MDSGNWSQNPRSGPRRVWVRVEFGDKLLRYLCRGSRGPWQQAQPPTQPALSRSNRHGLHGPSASAPGAPFTSPGAFWPHSDSTEALALCDWLPTRLSPGYTNGRLSASPACQHEACRTPTRSWLPPSAHVAAPPSRVADAAKSFAAPASPRADPRNGASPRSDDRAAPDSLKVHAAATGSSNTTSSSSSSSSSNSLHPEAVAYASANTTSLAPTSARPPQPHQDIRDLSDATMTLQAQSEALKARITTLERKRSEIENMTEGTNTAPVQAVTQELIETKLQYAENQEELERLRNSSGSVPPRTLSGGSATRSNSGGSGIVPRTLSGRSNSRFTRMRSSRTSSVKGKKKDNEGSDTLSNSGLNSESGDLDELEHTSEGQTLKVKGKKGSKKFYVDDVTAKYMEDRAFVEDDEDFTDTDDYSSTEEDDSPFPNGAKPVIHTPQARDSHEKTKQLAYRGIYGSDSRPGSLPNGRSSTVGPRTVSMRSSYSAATNATTSTAFRLERNSQQPGLKRVADGPSSDNEEDDDEVIPGVQIFEDTGESDKNTKVYLMDKLDAVVIREPAMSTLDYGTASWGNDMVAFIQNSVRREVFDLYYLYSSMSKRAYFLESDEFELFYKWFELFRYAVFEFQHLEEEIVYPALEAASPKSSQVFEAWHSKENRKIQKKKVRDAVDTIWDFQDKVKLQAPGAALKSIGNMMDTMSAIMLSYYNAQLRALPRFIQRLMKPAEIRTLEEKYVAAMRGKTYPHFLFQMIMHWSKRTSVEFRSRMRNAYLNRSNPVYKTVWKKQYASGRAEFRREHLRLVQGFFQRWNTFEEERIRAREEAPVSRFQNPFMKGSGEA